MTMVGIASPLLPPPVTPPPSASAAPAASSAAPAASSTPAVSAPGSSAPAGFRASAARTMLGMAAPLPPGFGGPAAVAPPTPDLAPPSAMPAASGKGKTMIGMAAPLMPAASAAAPAAPSAAAPAAPGAAAPAAPAGLSSKRTLLGVAPVVLPGQAPAPLAPTPGAAMPFAHGKGKTIIGMAAPTLPEVSKTTSSPRKTLIGVAFSNLVAPLTPTVTEPEYVEEFYDEVVPETGAVERRVRMVQKPLPPLYRRPGFYVLLGAPMVLGAGVVALLLLKKPAPVTAEARLDGEGNDLLHVTCESCPDGTRLTLPGVEPAEVKGHGADLRLKERLKVGENTLALAVDRPEGGRDETVTLVVPVAYRFNPDLNALQDPTPAVRVDVEALAGSVVTVQGKPLALDGAGRGSVKVDVQGELLALGPEQKVFRKEILYTIAVKGGAPESGKLAVQAGVVPLTLDSPGSNLLTDQATFLMAGHLPKGAGLTVSGAPVAVNPDGTFRQHLKIPGLGLAEVPLRASAHGMAPRLLSLKVKLVQNLRAEAKALDASGRPGYDEVEGKLDSAAGTAVAWSGKVISSSPPGNQVVAVVNVATGCAKKNCRARVVVPGGGPLAVGDAIGVYGRVVGAAVDRDLKLPDVEADFIVRQP